MVKIRKKRAIKKMGYTPGISSQKYLDILEKTLLSAGIPPTYFCIGGYGEEAICIEGSEKGIWIVYNGERGNKYHTISHANVNSACYDMISRLSMSEDDKFRMEHYYELQKRRCCKMF